MLVSRVCQRGGIAQLVERLVRNEKARGSNPLTSTFILRAMRINEELTMCKELLQ